MKLGEIGERDIHERETHGNIPEAAAGAVRGMNYCVCMCRECRPVREEEDAWGSGGDREERRVSRFWTYLKERITGSGDGNPTVLGEVDGGQHQV